MTKKKIALIQAITQLIAFVALFIPISFIRYFTNHNNFWKTYSYSESFISAADMSDNIIWGILLLIASVFALTYFVLYFTTKIQWVRKKYCIAIPCISLPILVTSVIIISANSVRYSNASECYSADWGFYLICALYLAIVALELYKHFSKIDEESKPKHTEPIVVQNLSSAEELKKFKELLDTGIITQEEFDAKKKELLGL